MSKKTPGLSKANLDLVEAKAACRKLAGQNRDQLAASETAAAAMLTPHAERLIDQFGKGVYAAYFPIRSELSPLDLLARLADLGCATALPVTPAQDQPLRFHRWAVGDWLDDGPYGTKQPPADQPLCRPNVILVPMLAFDSAGWRLGYGGGYYDRTLAALKGAGHHLSAIGIAHDGQKLDKIPVGPYDVPLDAVLCPTGLLVPLHSQN